MRRTGIAVVAACFLAAPASAGAQAQPPLQPLNDLFSFGRGGGQTPASAAVQHNAEPPLTATPPAKCGPGSRPEPGIQGRVPAESAVTGLTCNTQLVVHQGTSGGFKTLRYTDVTGRTCAFYDTALLFPLNALKLDTSSAGVAVLDMSDPVRPVQTDTLVAPPMLSPHESLVVNQKRGLIAAVLGNPATYPGTTAIYDAHADCRHPIQQSVEQVARFGHESGFSMDGKTFYATGTALQSIAAIDVTDPATPHSVWQGNVVSHGMSLSDDGNRGYIADPTAGQLLILDTSEIQARKPNPQAKEISRLTWKAASIPQNALPFTRDGKPYLLEIDEYTAGTTGGGSTDDVGAARIIDIGNERKPFVLSNLRLQVNQPAEHHAASGDPGANSPVQGYAAHYCNIPTRVNPTIVACSFIASGLRIFDITDIAHPKEIAYFVAPTLPRAENGFQASDFAMSQPAFDEARHDIWFTDGATGFYNVHVTNGVWPAAATPCQDAARSPHGYVIRRTLRGSRRGVSVRGKAFALCRRDAAQASKIVKRVTISIARVSKGRCAWLKANGKLSARRSCRTPVLLKVRGTKSWTFKRKTKLPPGHYRVYVSATDGTNRVEPQPRRQNARFRVH